MSVANNLAARPLVRDAAARTEYGLAAFGFALAAALLFATAPHNGEFWYSDAPRHALNGAFVKDLVAALPRDPKAWAISYYVQYPALTILFYPPLFYAILAPFYALFGVSHATALSVELIHYFALALGMYALARRWLGPLASFAAGLALMASPVAAFWGRQVMLDIPSLAFAVWAMVLLLRYTDQGRPRLLYGAVFLLLCAIYTKLNAVFLLPATALTLLAADRLDVRDRHLWFAALFAIAGLIPIALLTVEFGGANVQSAVGVGDSETSRFSLEAWIWYARQFPALLGWPLLALAAAAPVLFVLRRARGLSRADAMLLGSWFVILYVALSLIDLKGARHALFLLPPMIVVAGLTVSALVPRNRIGEALLLVIVVALGGYTWRWAPAPSVSGYREAAEWIAQHAGKNAIVVFSGERDGSFVFNMRAIESRRDIVTLRSDKLLLSVAVSRDYGVGQKNYSQAEIAELIDRDGASYVVAQDGFWTDIAVMKRLDAVLHSPHFEEVNRIPVVSNMPVRDKMLRIYRNLGQVNPHPSGIDLGLPIIGRSIAGRLSQGS